MCTNCDVYTDNEYLNKGIVLPQNEARSLLKSYTMFSDEYTPGDKITRSVARRIFEAEAMSVVKDGSYMGIWQLFCSASVAGVKILSVYPDLGDRLPKLLLHRTIMPRVFRTYQSEILIMWASTREDLHPDGHNWIPNHFVPLMPQTGDSELLFDIDDVDDDYASISLDDSLIDHIVQSVLHAEPELLADAKPELHVAKPELYPDAKPKLSSATLSNPDHSQLEDFKRPLNGTSPSGKTLHSTHIGRIGALSHCDKEYPTSSDEMKLPFKGQTKKSPMKNPARNDNTDLPPSGQTGPQSTGKVEPRSIDEAHPQSSCETQKSTMLDFTTGAQTEPLPTDGRYTPPVGKTCPPSNIHLDPASSDHMVPPSRGKVVPLSSGKLDSPYSCETHKRWFKALMSLTASMDCGCNSTEELSDSYGQWKINLFLHVGRT
ncbi:hypothetical protein MAR_017744 [Mya arenaria]|uniref:Uncharacterized protein n=1 Tax=Mya arenaria TaxID=6604 RepID=A0ABY7EG64_MYAAR|nr:uncharacterized protein LOC128237675 [Mya arenaria]WAR07786.1 hypothetical protein MAR_017744 [Mya arenaria]